MEYFLMFVITLILPILTNKYIFDDITHFSTTQLIILPYLVLGGIVYFLTVFFTSIRAVRTCEEDEDEGRSWAISSGLKLGIFSSIFAVIFYFIIGLIPILKGPILALSFLPYVDDLAEGFWLAMGGTIGYWIGRMFIGIC